MAARNGYRPCSKCRRNRAEKFYTSPRGRVCSDCRKKSRSKASHEKRVTATYGPGPGEYDVLFEAQDGRCAICREPRRQRLSVDHDHKSGLVRGLLCRRHNGQLLPAARDRPEILRAAAEYLENPPALRHIGERRYRGQ